MSRPVALFVCQHNAGRSRLGAALLEHLAGDRFEVLSGGTIPADAPSPDSTAALAELGIDVARLRPRAVTAADVARADHVFSMKPGLELPGELAGERIEWRFADPPMPGLDGARWLRDEIRAALEQWLRLR